MASHFVRWKFTTDRNNTYRIPNQVIESSMFFNEHRAKQYLSARILLAELMARIYGCQQLPQLQTTCTGRPQFVDPGLPDFSIAYAGNMVGILLAEENGYAGLDMEIVRPCSNLTTEYYQKYLSSAEKAWIEAQNDPVEAIMQIWTIHQSVLKLTNEVNSQNSLQLHPASGRLRSVNHPDIQAICDTEPVFIWSCAVSPATEPLYLWEIDDQNNWHCLREIDFSNPNIGPRSLRMSSLPPRSPYAVTP